MIELELTLNKEK